eukprot:gene10386-21663_t
MSDRLKALSLYRLILPLDLRMVGDDYVRNEFKQHKNATSQFLPDFFRSWRDYLTMLNVQSNDRVFGMNLDNTERNALSKDQSEKLKVLKKEVDNENNNK